MVKIDETMRLVYVREPKTEIVDGIYKATENIIAQQAEFIDNFTVESIVKCLPENITKVLVLDKKKIIEVFEYYLKNCREE